jgi:hypothetical protein
MIKSSYLTIKPQTGERSRQYGPPLHPDNTMTFHHTFQNGHTATATLTAEGLRVEWQPDVPSKGHREEIKAEYLTWTRQCFQLYADKVGGAVVYLNLATGEPEIITPSKK